MIGENLLLRAPEPADIDIIFRWENDMRIWQISNTLVPYSRFAVEQFVLNTDNDIFSTKQLRLMIDLHSAQPDTATVGIIDLFDFDPHHKRAGVGILIDEGSRQKGFATEAMKLLINYGFNTLNLHQLYCTIEQDNLESIRLFTRVGFSNCGHKREWLYRNGQWTDVYMFQLLNNS
jgi:diamine N-acetyltransferase